MKIAVGGMIASGKSTLVENLGRKLDMPIMEEFSQDDEVFNTLLKWLYSDDPNINNVEMLLQIYFIHNHFITQQKYDDHYIVDRDIVEHWLFAQENLKNTPTVMNMYNGVFMAYMNQIKRTDLYIILDMSWETFEKRIFKRGRKEEIDNYDAQVDYFKRLHSTYIKKLTAQCEIYNIPYTIIQTDNLNAAEVLDIALDRITKFKEGSLF